MVLAQAVGSEPRLRSLEAQRFLGQDRPHARAEDGIRLQPLLARLRVFDDELFEHGVDVGGNAIDHVERRFPLNAELAVTAGAVADEIFNDATQEARLTQPVGADQREG